MPNDLLGSEVLARFGLNRQPFTDDAPDEFLYFDPAIEAPVKVLLDKARDGGPLILLRGEPGAGKSTLILRYLSLCSPDLPVCAFKANEGADLTDIATALREWASASGREVEGQTVREIIEDFLVAGRPPVLVVDDADRLDPDALAALLRLRSDFHDIDGHTFCLLLAGPPALEARLAALGPDAADRVVVALRPLTENQTAAYLRHRLQVAGNDSPDDLDEGVVRRIHQQSGGLFGRINAAARTELTARARNTGTTLTPKADVTGTGGEEIVMAKSGGGISVVVGDDDGPPRGSAAGRGAIPPWKPGGKLFLPLLAGGGAILVIAAALLTFLLLKGEKPVAERTVAIEIPPAASSPGDGTKPEDAPADKPPAELSPATEAGRAETAPQGQQEAVPEGAPAPAAEEAPPQPEAPQPTKATQPVEPEKPAPPGASAPVAPEPSAKAEAAPAPKPGSAAPPPASPSAAKSVAMTDGAAWVRAQKPTWYTIQIAGFATEKGVRDFARQHGLAGKSAWVKTVRNGADWYVLLTGSYPGPEAARDAIDKLPEAVRKNNPWIRTFGSVRAVMPK